MIASSVCRRGSDERAASITSWDWPLELCRYHFKGETRYEFAAYAVCVAWVSRTQVRSKG